MKQLGKKAKGLLLLVLCAALILPCVNGHALTQKQKALNAYKRFLSKSKVNVLAPGTIWYKNFRPMKYTPTNAAKVKFGIAYIDNDNIPEMVLLGKVNKYGKRDDIFAIFTYRNGKVVRVKSGNYDYMRFAGYYSRTGTFKYLFYDDGGEAEHNYCMLRNGRTSEKIRKWVPGEWAASQGVKCNYYKRVSTKKVNITYSAFMRLYKSMTKSKKMSTVKFYKNTAANRRAKLR